MVDIFLLNIEAFIILWYNCCSIIIITLKNYGDNMKNKNNIVIGCISALTCETIYGLSCIFTKSATENASALSLLGWRFFTAFIAINMLVIFKVFKINLKGKNLKPLLIISLFSPIIYFIGETFGIQNTTASETGVFLASVPIISLIFSTLILNKKPTKYELIGIIVTLIGVLVTVLAAKISSSQSVIGYLFLLIAIISYALYCVFVEKASNYTGAEVTYMMITSGAVVFVVLAIIESIMNGNFQNLATIPFTNKAFLSAILYQGLGCSILGFFLSNVALSNIGVNRTSSFIGVATVVSILSGAIVLGEPFTRYQIIGAVVIVTGVYIANAKPKKKLKLQAKKTVN